jgi:hypothetical protein
MRVTLPGTLNCLTELVIAREDVNSLGKSFLTLRVQTRERRDTYNGKYSYLSEYCLQVDFLCALYDAEVIKPSFLLCDVSIRVHLSLKISLLEGYSLTREWAEHLRCETDFNF